jgi:hypothetical protein
MLNKWPEAGVVVESSLTARMAGSPMSQTPNLSAHILRQMSSLSWEPPGQSEKIMTGFVDRFF